MPVSGMDTIRTEVTGRLDAALNKLYHIWNMIGICEAQMHERATTVSLHLCNLLEEMVEEESVLRTQIQQNITSYTEDIKTLSEELAVPAFQTKESQTMLQKEKELRTKVESLTQEKTTRMKQLKTLHDEDQSLCEALCAVPYYIASGSVPSIEQLKELEKHIAANQIEKAIRLKEFLSTKKEIVDLFNEMDKLADTSFERDIMCEDDDMFVLSQSNMRSLKSLLQMLLQQRTDLKQSVENLWMQVHALWDRLDIDSDLREAFSQEKEGFKPHVMETLRDEVTRCEKLKFQNIQRFIEGIRRELTDWWNKCFYSKAQRDEFLFMSEEEYTERLLDFHEQELEKVRMYYELHRDILTQVERRETIFKRMIEFEERESDPSRYKNRRFNALQSELKERKLLAKELPKVEADVKRRVKLWEEEHKRPFLVDGVPYEAYIDLQRDTYHEQKRKEKEHRQMAKAKQIQEEMLYGSKPTTPSKRGAFGTTPNRTPNKVRKVDSSISINMHRSRKLNDTTKTPTSISRRIQHTSVFASPYRRAPLATTTKTPSTKSQKRRSLRLTRKVLGERNTGAPSDSLFSQTTVSSKDSGCSASNSSLASTGSYKDFSVKCSRRFGKK